jgi:hypothetical protein
VLNELLDGSPPAIRDNAAVRSDCEVLQKVWPASRYPMEAEPSLDEAQGAAQAARRVRATIERALGEMLI